MTTECQHNHIVWDDVNACAVCTQCGTHNPNAAGLRERLRASVERNRHILDRLKGPAQ